MTEKNIFKQNKLDHSLFLALSGAGIAESFGERVVVDLELRYLHDINPSTVMTHFRFTKIKFKNNTTKCTNLFVLIGGDGDELGLFENVGSERAVRQLEDVVGADEVEPRLVFVHRIQDGLL